MKKIPSAPLYSAGEDGHVYGQDGRRLRAAAHSTGYLRVAIYVGTMRRNRYVHHLVAEAFHGPRPAGLVCRHLNSDPHDNRPSNVVYGTARENIHDQIALGTRPRGERIVWTTLSDTQVVEARRRVASGEKQNVIARELGVSKCSINRAVTGQTFSHLPGAIQKRRYQTRQRAGDRALLIRRP